MSVDLSFVSIGCNRLANCASWSSSGLIAYGAGSFVALYNMNVCFFFNFYFMIYSYIYLFLLGSTCLDITWT